MRDFPLRAWVANGNGSEKYNVMNTKQHGDVKAVTVTLHGENKINLLFTVLSTDQRSKQLLLCTTPENSLLIHLAF